MQRIPIDPRENWRDKVEKWGLLFHTMGDTPYWFEEAYYQLTAVQVEQLETATESLQELCLKAVEHVIEKNRFAELAIPEKAIPAITSSWKSQVPAIYGRFDLAYDGTNPPRMLEYNADTPTCLLESAVIQWQWLQELAPQADQFNSIWEGLVEKWKALKEPGVLKGNPVYFAHVDDIEDLMTVSVLRDTAQEAGLPTDTLDMGDIGWDSTDKCFVDLENKRIQTMFKLYPWEWMLGEQFGDFALQTYDQVQWIEPIWKMVLSNKGILPILWELFPESPYLLKSYSGGPKDLVDYVKKPLLSREGANITLHVGGQDTETQGEYGQEGFVYQEYFPLPEFDGNHPIFGSWVIDGEPRGVGIRESTGPVTDNYSRFIPHLFA